MQRKITEAHIVLIVTFVIYMGFQLIQQWFPINHTAVRITVGQMMLFLPGFIWMRLRYRGQDFDERLSLKPISGANVKMALAVLVCSYPAIVALNMMTLLFVKNVVTPILSSVIPLGLVPTLIIMALIPACVEEFLCRGILYGVYAPVSKVGGVVLSALIFGLLHLNFNQMVYAFYIGMIFALMNEATGSLYISMLMHGLLNGFNVFLSFLDGSADSIPADEAETSQQVLGNMAAASPEKMKLMLILVGLVLFFTAMTAIIIYQTFRLNGRSLKMKVRAEQKENMTGETAEGGSGRIIDIWIIIFIGFALILTYFNTNFL